MIKASDYTAEQITDGIAEAVKARDWPAVVSLLKMLAVVDPRQAQVLYESMLFVLDSKDGSGDDGGSGG